MRDSSFWSDVVTRVLNIYAIVTFAVLWVGFAIALVVNREWLDLLWNWVRALPSVAQIIVWVLFLPGMVGCGSGSPPGQLAYAYWHLAES